jgi:hypothetical protein
VSEQEKVKTRRQYKSGTAWCFWRWTDVASEYIVRLHVVKTPWFAICLHWFHKPDPEPFDHDHPVTFLSLILRGSYTEQRNGKLKTRRWFNFIRASDADEHTIVALSGKPLSLCFMGPKRREWGFHRPQGWIGWKAYYAEQRAQHQLRDG